MNTMIVADEQIPGIAQHLGRFGEVRLLPGHEISSSDLKDATALIVRSVTHVDSRLLKGTGVRFVGSATAGIDHIAPDILESDQITFEYAAGCNAPAVCDWVLAAIFEMASKTDIDPFRLTVGIIGVGNVGSRLHRRLDAIGIETLLNDPPLEESGDPSRQNEIQSLVDLDSVLAGADIITLHVPLTHDSPHPTMNLIGEDEIASLKTGTWIVNSSRGGVVNERMLRDEIHHEKVTVAIVDTWVDEPTPDCELVNSASLATPHIAGYAIEAKHRASLMIAERLAVWLGEEGTGNHTPVATARLPIAAPPPGLSDREFCAFIIRQAYDIGRDHLRMQAMCSFPQAERAQFFRELRDNYRFRNEFASYVVPDEQLTDRQARIAAGIGMRVGPLN